VLGQAILFCEMQDQPTVIDITGLVEGDEAALARVAKDLRDPCHVWGMFHVTGHSLPSDELAEFEEAMRQFFDLPDSAKEVIRRSRDNAWGYYNQELTKNQPDWKEVFDYGAERSPDRTSSLHSDGTNQWPTELPDLKPILVRHYLACERIGLALLRALVVSLGHPAETLDHPFQDHSSFVRLNLYSICPEPAAADADYFPERGHLGVHHHTDAGALTILYQDEVAGLQAEIDGQFLTIEPVQGAFTVNLGDMLQVWSNDRYRSPLHRVIVHSDRARVSAPFFLNPRYDTICQPLANALEPSAAPRFRPISWAHFRDQRSAGDYADYGAEIQIDDYRIAEQ
jgi:isopenicillin N synthase-like dioxygenase